MENIFTSSTVESNRNYVCFNLTKITFPNTSFRTESIGTYRYQEKRHSRSYWKKPNKVAIYKNIIRQTQVRRAWAFMKVCRRLYAVIENKHVVAFMINPHTRHVVAAVVLGRRKHHTVRLRVSETVFKRWRREQRRSRSHQTPPPRQSVRDRVANRKHYTVRPTNIIGTPTFKITFVFLFLIIFALCTNFFPFKTYSVHGKAFVPSLFPLID